jgi:hypothetical protein
LSDVSYYWLPIFDLGSVKFGLRDLDLVFTNLLFCNKFFQTWPFVLGEIFGQICFSSSFATRFSVSLGGKIQFSSFWKIVVIFVGKNQCWVVLTFSLRTFKVFGPIELLLKTEASKFYENRQD